MLLHLVNEGPMVKDGAFLLLESALEYDVAHVWMSGSSHVEVAEGVPEGGSLGPLLYNLLPDGLVRRLYANGHGFGIVNEIPTVWKCHSWSGHGNPIGSLVDAIRGSLRNGGSLPSVAMMARHPDMEASALRALDLETPVRLPCLFHADDPILLASSRGALQFVLNEVAEWCADVGVEFHIGPNKTGCMTSDHVSAVFDPITFNGKMIEVVDVHKWLGILWSCSLDFHGFLAQRLQLASTALAQLVGFAASLALPWYLVCELFETKVDSFCWILVGVFLFWCSHFFTNDGQGYYLVQISGATAQFARANLDGKYVVMGE